MNRTKIEWCATYLPDGTTRPGFTSNPIKFRDGDGKVVWGCVHASPGCTNCYAEALAHRYGRGGPFTAPKMSVMSPRNTRDPAGALDRRMARSSASSTNGVSPCIVGAVNGPPLP